MPTARCPQGNCAKSCKKMRVFRSPPAGSRDHFRLLQKKPCRTPASRARGVDSEALFRRRGLGVKKKLFVEPRKGRRSPDKKYPAAPDHFCRFLLFFALFCRFFAVFCRFLQFFAVFCRFLPFLPATDHAECIFELGDLAKTVSKKCPLSGQRISRHEDNFSKFLGPTGVRKRIYGKNAAERCGRHPRGCLI